MAFHHIRVQVPLQISLSPIYHPIPIPFPISRNKCWEKGFFATVNGSTRKKGFCVNSSSSLSDWVPEKTSKAPSLSDVVWPSAGAFAAMALLGKIDQILAPKGISMTIAPLGAVCAVLFATPSSPGARKYNMFMAQIGCAAIGVLAFTILGPGWVARSAALAAAVAFMIATRSVHPPAASLPLLFIDGAKLHGLNFCKRWCVT
ncbi:uncharacterized protein LOC127241577 isoform X2 [Andrographis paniculata]|uniref:uncharacterized protein LOC127241577 isoform X2 n=1 Tax=Andrographis paniculata TaxID=175694 RepID=UPI0021E90B4C|nr:uncharacterized protein LOC127241577 isoform X2 [Andrographis paniculata]